MTAGLCNEIDKPDRRSSQPARAFTAILVPSDCGTNRALRRSSFPLDAPAAPRLSPLPVAVEIV